MKRIVIFSIFCSILSATTWHVSTTGSDETGDGSAGNPFAKIQHGIDTSVAGDTVLVADGAYYENLTVNKEITLASHYISDGYLSHRDNTIIDGSQYDEEEGPFGSCVVFRPSENGDAISPKLTGFTIQNGLGTRVNDSSGDETITYFMGGGLMIWHTLPQITYNYIRDNGSESDTRAGSTRRGGAAGLNTDDNVEFDEDRNEYYPTTQLTRDDEIIFSNNIFENNDSETGNTFESNGYEGEVDFSYSVFDVFASGHEDISEYWVVKNEASTDYFEAEGELEAITYDVWVSPNADGSDSSSTDGTEDDPFYTIDYALSRIFQAYDNPITIYLYAGTYAPSTTGEEFPLIMFSNINLIGQGEDVTIIDAEQTDRVITMEDCENNILSNFTITGGNIYNNKGGGMYIKNSNPTIMNMTIRGNTAFSNGGGLYLGSSNPTLTYVTISENTAVNGGGMFLIGSQPTLDNVIISNNETIESGGGIVGRGGGIFIEDSHPKFTNCIISDNSSYHMGGGMYVNESSVDLLNATISNNIGGGGMMINDHSNATLINCIISNNISNERGGGIGMGSASNLTLYNVIISGNQTSSDGGGLATSTYTQTNLTNVLIIGNEAEQLGGGLYIVFAYEFDNNILTNVTISENISGIAGGGIYGEYGTMARIKNSIIWNNNPQSISNEEEIENHPIISYSDIEGEWEGEGNISLNPLFTNPENDEYTLQEGSPCIDSGDPNLWYQDQDGTPSDMGFTGGLSVFSNFTSYDFGGIGINMGSSVYFNLFNNRETSITFDDMIFNTTSFSTSSTFPLTIYPNESGEIEIICQPESVGFIESSMEIVSPDLPEGLEVILSVTGTSDNSINGNLSGELPSSTYHITADINVQNGDTLKLNPGTIFLFDPEYEFTIEGVLIAEGTESDSIIFKRFESDRRWRGITLNNVTEETIFNYVRISGAAGHQSGGGMYLSNSNPTMQNVKINNNGAGWFGGGIYFLGSHPTLINCTISGCSAEWGGGMFVELSHPTFINCTISGNTALWMGGGGIWLEESNSTFNNVTIVDNYSYGRAAGININGSPTLNNVTIKNNYCNGNGGGLKIEGGSNPILDNCTISDNESERGGGIYSEGNLTLSNVIISGNTATMEGGGLWINNSDPILINCTITGNVANQYGGGIFVNYWASNPIIINSILFTNDSESIYLNSGTPLITYSDIEGGWEGEGNIDSDPLFVASDSDDFYLQENSPCIDAGTAYYEANGEVILDLDQSNYYGPAPDMGAFEFEEDIPSPEGPDFAVFLEAGSNEYSIDMTVGFSPDATDGYDEGIDSYSPPAPPPPSFDAALGWGGDRYYTQILAGLAEDEGVEHVFDILLQYDTNNLITLTWDNTGWSGVMSSCILEDSFGGGMFSVDMLTNNSLELTNPAFNLLKLKVTPVGTTTSASVEYLEGWNIVGLPLYVEDASYGTLFSDAVNGTLYGYEGSYYGSDVLEAGNGYWLVFTTDGSADISGEAITSLTISLSEGWNLITGISSPVAVESIIDPGDIIVSGTIYGYGGSYYNAEAIEPGKGYWINASADGEITMSSTNLVTKTLAQINHLEGSNELDFNNGEYSAIIYFGKEVADEHKDSYSLPPTFPQMAFDVRFNGDMKYTVESGDIEVLNTSDNLIVSYDIVIDAGEHMNWVLSSESDEEYILEGTGEITIPTEETFTLERKAIIPISYTLHQNYPNPFNPITSLRYDLPVQAQVTLTVYDLLGREVTQLVNTTQDAGYRSVQWNATDMHGKPVSAGVYLYQIQAEEFVQTRKMVLLK